MLVEIPIQVTRYPPPYYWVVGLPTRFMAGESAVYAMRLISAALAAGLVALGLFAAAPVRRTWLALGVAIAFTPMAAHLAGSVNPSGFEVAAALGLGVGLLGLGVNDKRKGRSAIAALVLLAAALAWARPQSYLVLGAVIAASILLNSRGIYSWLRERNLLRFVIPTTAITTASAVAFEKWFRHLPIIPGGYPQPPPGIDPPQIVGQGGQVASFGISLGEAFRVVEQRSVEFAQHLVGRFGWIDHSPPTSVVVGWLLLGSALVTLAFALGTRRDRVALSLVGVGGLLLAPVFIIVYGLRDATIYQARYQLPLAVLVVIGAVSVLQKLGLGPQRAPTWSAVRWGAIFVPVGMAFSIASSLHRYSIGGGAQLSDLWDLVTGFHEWLPPRGAMGIAGLGAIILVMMPFAIGRITRSAPDVPD